MVCDICPWLMCGVFTGCAWCLSLVAFCDPQIAAYSTRAQHSPSGVRAPIAHRIMTRMTMIMRWVFGIEHNGRPCWLWHALHSRVVWGLDVRSGMVCLLVFWGGTDEHQHNSDTQNDHAFIGREVSRYRDSVKYGPPSSWQQRHIQRYFKRLLAYGSMSSFIVEAAFV